MAFHEEGRHLELFHLAMKNERYREVFLMCVEKMYIPDEMLLAVATHAKRSYIDEGVVDEYIISIINDLLQSHIPMDRRIRGLLNEIAIDFQLLEVEGIDTKREDEDEVAEVDIRDDGVMNDDTVLDDPD